MIAALLPLVSTVVFFGLLGAAIGFVCYKKIGLQLAISSTLSLLVFIAIQFKAGTLSFKASLLTNFLGSAVYLLAPFVIFCLLPTTAVSVLVGHWRRNQRSGAEPQAQIVPRNGHNLIWSGRMKKALSALSVSYLVYALLTSCFVVFFILRAYGVMSSAAAEQPLPIAAWLFFGAVSFLTAMLIAMLFLLGYFLAVRRYWKAALVMAAFSVLSMPIGTILGILSIYVLTRPQVASEFTS